MPARKILVAPSILAADFAHLADDVDRVVRAGADWLHLDIMDGQFVDNISFGPAVVETVRGLTSLPLDVHLMIERPDHYAPRFIAAGANSITVHVEAEAKHNVAQTLGAIRAAGCRCGLTLNPATPFDAVEPHLPNVDLVLIMTVHPGFGGQSFRAEMMEKVRRARELRESLGANYDIEVDGGINPETARLTIENGANALVAGTSIFKAPDYAAAIEALRGQAASRRFMETKKDQIELSAVEDHGGILTIRGGGARRDWNGIHYKQGMSAKNVGTTRLSANVATIPPGGVAYAHIHVGFELILYILEGRVRHEFGEGCKQVLENEAGDFIYIKPDVPHEVFNMSETEPVVAFVARSSAEEWDNIVTYDRKQAT